MIKHYYTEPGTNVTLSQWRETTHSSNDTLYENTTTNIPPATNQVAQVVIGVLMTAVILATIVGNLIVISAFIKFKSLKTMNNCFIVSLAVADLLVGLLVQPFNMYNEMVKGEWRFGHIVCNIYNSNDVFYSTASLLHLCCISCDRYIAILHPFAYETTITKFRVMLMIAGSWVLSACLSFVPIFAGIYAPSEHIAELRNNDKLCNFKVSRPYAFISSSISFWIPCTVMVVLYQRILSTALRQEKQIRAMMRPPLPSIPSEEGSEQPMLKNGNAGSHETNGHALATPTWSEDGQTSSDETDYNENLESRLSGQQTESDNSNRYPVKKDIKQMKKLRKEHRAAKTLGIIMGCFIACMGPIFLWYTITFGICPETCTLSADSEWVVTLVFWVGYLNSCMNPIIYAFFNREFQLAYKRLFKVCQNTANREAWRRQSTSSDMATPSPTVTKRSVRLKVLSHTSKS